MKWRDYFFFVFFSFLGVFFGSCIISQNNVYAVDDLVVNIYGQTSSNVFICGQGSSYNCSDYNYAYFTFTCSVSPCNANFASTITLRDSSSNSSFTVTYRPYVQSFLLFDTSYINRLYISSNTFNYLDSSDFLTVTLSENNPFGGSAPSGSISITENGTYDVSSYAEAVVQVPEEDCPEGSGGDYHNDLVAINNSIMVCAATCLVIYFFYCIYRMIIKNSGVK